MAGSFSAEVLKLRKRPAVRVWGGVWLALVVLLYLLPGLAFAVIAANTPPEAGTSLGGQLYTLTPGNLPAYLLRFLFPYFGTPVALILGASTAGSEYGWGTLKIVLSQRSGRLGVLFGKLLALCFLLLVFVLAAFLVGALSSLVVALFSGASPAPPPVAGLLEGLGVGALILVLWAALGFALATLFKGTGLAVGLGLIYAFAIEPVFAGFATLSDSLRTIAELLPGVNTSLLAMVLVETAGAPAEEGLPSPGQSALIMLIYVAVFVLVTILVFRRRDVT